MSTSPPPTLRVRTERRRHPLRIGIAIGAFGLFGLVAGAVITWTNQALQVAAPVARVALPSSTTFEAEDRGYVIVLDRVSSASRLGITKADPVVDVRCSIARADGSTVVVDGSRSTVRTDTDLGTSVGRFEASQGTTTVECDWARLPSAAYRFVIAPERQGLVVAGMAGVIGGIAMLLLAIPFLWIGIRGRAVVEREPSVAGKI
ncbi:hypothetical protein [Actinospongicola halichondriae]|uniref:hypothetical protein n=1 Tax=Actinospongicola halichondriae TaxID=3236844 RepID=UPI003D453312